MTAIALLILGSIPIGDLDAVAKRMGVPPDPSNGFFDVVMAADLVVADFVPYERALMPNPTDVPPELLQLKPLEVRRKALAGFSQVSDLLHQAWRKKIWDPRPPASRFKYPGYPHFARLGTYLTSVVTEVEMADGNWHRATQAMVDALQVAETAEAMESHAGALYSYALQAMVLRSVSSNLSRIAVTDCLTLNEAVRRMIKARPYERAAERHLEVTLSSFQTALRDQTPGAMDEFGKAGAAFSAASPAQRAIYADQAAELIRKAFAESASVMRLGIKEMAQYIDEHPRAITPSDREQDQYPIPVRLAAMVAPGPANLEYAFLRDQQLRVLRATLELTRYRWHFDALPTSPVDLFGTDIMIDPVTGKPYRIRVIEGGFEVIGSGPKSIGDVKLNTIFTPPMPFNPPPGVMR